MVSRRALFKTALSLSLVGPAVPVVGWASGIWIAPADETPPNVLNMAAEPNVPLSKGTILLRRTEEALPPPSQAQLDEKLRILASNAARAAAGEVKAETLAQMSNRQSDVDYRLSQLTRQTQDLLSQTRDSIVAAETRLTSLAQSSAAQTAAVLQANTSAQQSQMASQRDALLAMSTQNQTLQGQLAGLQTQTAQAIQALASQQAASTADAKEYARLQALTAQLTAQKDALDAAQKAAQAAETRMRQATQEQLATTQTQTAQALQTLAARQQQDAQSGKEFSTLQATLAKQEAMLAAVSQTQSVAQALQAKVADTKAETAQTLQTLAARQQQDAQSVKEYAALQAENAKQAAVIASLNQNRQLAQALQAQVANTKAETAQALQTLAARQQQDAQSGKEFSTLQAQNAKQAALLQLASSTQAVQAQMASLQAQQTASTVATNVQIASLKDLTNARLAALETLTVANRKLAEVQTDAVASQLRHYADTQMAQLAYTTSDTLARVAETARQDVATLRTQTTGHLVSLWQAAQAQAARMAEEKANIVAQNLARLESETNRQRLTSAQVKELANQTIAESQPAFRALALQTLKDGQDYIRTVARNTLQNPDAAVSEALANATRDVITKDNKIVFALRKAVEQDLNLPGTPAVTVNVAAASPSVIRLGNGWPTPVIVTPAATVAEQKPASPMPTMPATAGTSADVLKDLVALQTQTVQLLAKMKTRGTVDTALQAELLAQKDALARIQAQVAARQTAGVVSPTGVGVLPSATLPAPQLAALPSPVGGQNALSPLTASETVALNTARLRIAALQDPTVVKATSATLADAFLAALSPAAGNPAAPVAAMAVSQTGAQLTAAGAPTWNPPAIKGKTSLMSGRPRISFMDIRQYKVVIHDDNKTLENLVQDVVSRAEPFVGPWQVKWKISEDNKDILNEKFSLDAETTFDDFAAYVAQYMVNERGVKLSFNLFDNERIIVISD